MHILEIQPVVRPTDIPAFEKMLISSTKINLFADFYECECM